MRQNIRIILCYVFCVVCFSCQNSANKSVGHPSLKPYNGTWFKLNQSPRGYELAYCGHEIESLQITEDSILHHCSIEDVIIKRNQILIFNDTTAIYTDQSTDSYYKLIWVNKDTGIIKLFQKVGGGPEIEKFFVDRLHSSKIARSRGDGEDCMPKQEPGDPVDDSVLIGDGTLRAYIESGNCISIRDKNKLLQFERCLEDGNLVEFRHLRGNFLPLTFMSGQHYMDVDFFLVNSRWVSKSIIFYKHTPTGERKFRKLMTVDLNSFDFGSVAEKFD